MYIFECLIRIVYVERCSFIGSIGPSTDIWNENVLIYIEKTRDNRVFQYLHKYSCILQKLENALRKEEIMTTEFGKALRKMRIEKSRI